MAPPIDSDDDEEYDEDDESYEEEEESEELEGQQPGGLNGRLGGLIRQIAAPSETLDEDSDIKSQDDDFYYDDRVNASNDRGSPGAKFGGLVGMLARAIDAEQKEYDESHREDEDNQFFGAEDEHESEEMVGLKRYHSPQQPIPIETSSPQGIAETAGSTAAKGNVGTANVSVVNSSKVEPPIQSSVASLIGRSDHEVAAVNRGLETADEDSSEELEELDLNPQHDQPVQPEPKTFGLRPEARESGSLSPMKQKSPLVIKSHLVRPLNLDSDDEGDDRQEISRFRGEGVSRQEGKVGPSATKSFEAMQRAERSAPAPLVEKRSAKIASKQPNGHSMPVVSATVEPIATRSKNEPVPRESHSTATIQQTAARSTTSEQVQRQHISPHQRSPKFKAPPKVAPVENNGRLSSPVRPVENPKPQSILPPAPFLEGNDKAEETTAQPAKVTMKHRGAEEQKTTAPSASPKPAQPQPTEVAKSEPELHAPAPANVTLSETNQEFEIVRQRLEKQCEDLQRKLRRAEDEVSILTERQKQSNAAASTDDKMEALLTQFQEKEARLLAAAQEDHEQEMKMMRVEMDNKFTLFQNEMEEERLAFERERNEMKKMMKDAMVRAEQAERQQQIESNKQESVFLQQQKKAEREARKNADKLAQTMALLDEREEQVSKLKKMVKDLESNMHQHREGAQEAEDEMDELHNENEELRHHVEEVEAQCADLQARLTELEADSERLSALKVSLTFGRVSLSETV